MGYKPQKIVRKISECIYCGTLQGLTDEHVIPFALGGHAVLSKASCKNCARITSKHEGSVLRKGGMWYEMRRAHGIRSRRPKRDSFNFSYNTDNEISREASINYDDAIVPVPIPRYCGRPPHLDNRIAGEEELPVSWQMLTTGNGDISILGNSANFTVNISRHFERMMLKISYCALVGRIGLRNVTPLTLNQILEKDRGMFNFIGELPHGIEATSSFGYIDHPRDDGRFVVSTWYRPISGDGCPTYEMVSGLIDRPLLEYPQATW